MYALYFIPVYIHASVMLSRTSPSCRLRAEHTGLATETVSASGGKLSSVPAEVTPKVVLRVPAPHPGIDDVPAEVAHANRWGARVTRGDECPARCLLPIDSPDTQEIALVILGTRCDPSGIRSACLLRVLPAPFAMNRTTKSNARVPRCSRPTFCASSTGHAKVRPETKKKKELLGGK